MRYLGRTGQKHRSREANAERVARRARKPSKHQPRRMSSATAVMAYNERANQYIAIPCNVPFHSSASLHSTTYSPTYMPISCPLPRLVNFYCKYIFLLHRVRTGNTNFLLR